MKVRTHAMNRRSFLPPATHAEDFSAELMATPGLAEAYIKVTQEIYDKKVKSGELSPAAAKKALPLVRLFHREMVGAIVRRECVRMGKRMLRMKRKERLSRKDMEFLEQCMQDLPMLEKQIKKAVKEVRTELEDFLDKVGFELLLLCEKMLVQGLGKAEVRDLLTEGGLSLPSELARKAKSHRLKARRAPESGAAKGRAGLGPGPVPGRGKTGR